MNLTNNNLKNIRDWYRGINAFRKGYQPGTDAVKNEKDNLVTDSHSILARWRNHFSQLLNVHGIHNVWQTEIHTAEPQEPEPSIFKVEMVLEKLKRH